MSETPRSSVQKKVAIILAVLIVIGVVGGGLWLAYQPADDLIQGMADSDEIRVAAKVTARVEALQVTEGDDVKVGQMLATLTSPEIAAKRSQARAALAGAEAMRKKADTGSRRQDLAAARAQLLRAQASAELARKTSERTGNLFRAGVLTEQKQDEAAASASTAVEAMKAAQADYDKAVEGSRVEDKAAAGAQVAQAEGAVAEITALLDETELKAPVSGQVSKRLANVGELVPAGYPVYSMVDLSKMWVALNLREDQFHGLKVGQSLLGDIPALDKTGVAFTVYYISPQGDFATWRATRQSSGYDVKSFEVRARPQKRIDNFRPGMSVLFHWPQ
jgi:HlyD family secretion protein